jgi:hypothetical protein
MRHWRDNTWGLNAPKIDAREDLTRNEKIAAKVAAGMTLQAVGEQHGISRERVRQIVKPLRNLEGSAMSRNAKNHRGAQFSWRLQAVMECLNPVYGEWGGQKKFAADVGVHHNTFNKVMTGTPLSKKVASAIVEQFGDVSLDFLLKGKRGRGDAKFEQKLLAWQHRTGKQIFSDDDKAGRVADDVIHEIPLPRDAPKTKAKTDVEVDPVGRLQEPVDAVRRSMIEYAEPTLRSALVIAGLRVVIAKAQELIAEFEDEANPGGGSR